MADTPSSTSDSGGKASGWLRFILPVLLVIAVVAVIGFIAAKRAGLDHDAMEAVVGQWRDDFNARNPNRQLSYERLEIGKGETAPVLRVHHPKLTTRRETQDGESETMELMTPLMEIHPESVTLDAFRLVFPQPVLARSDGTDELRIRSETPLVVAITQQEEREGEPALLLYRWELPSKTTFDLLEDAETLVLTLDDTSELYGSSARDVNQRGDVHLNLHKVVLTPGKKEDLPLRIDHFGIDTGWRDLDQEKGALRGVIEIHNVYTSPADMPYGPLTLNADFDYSGPVPMEGETVDWAQEKALFDLRHLTLQAEDAALRTRMQFQTGTGDLLPVGTAEVEISNFAFIRDELRKHGLLGGDEEKLLGALLHKASGQKLDEIQDLKLDIERKDGGSLRIGQSSFEELFAIFLTGGKLAAPPPSVTSEPEAPAAEPVSPDASGDPVSKLDEGDIRDAFDE